MRAIASKEIICFLQNRKEPEMTQSIDIKKFASNPQFNEGDYIDAEKKMYSFYEKYSNITKEEALEIRNSIDPKYRAKLFRIASSILKKLYEKSNELEKERLIKIFFASFSFDNLNFSYNSIHEINKCTSFLKEDITLSRKIWEGFKPKTSNKTAIETIEKKIFSS